MAKKHEDMVGGEEHQVKGEHKKNEIMPPEYSEEEQQYRSFLMMRLQEAKSQRDQAYPEFNDMTYINYWLSNARAANSYIRPKVNKGDTRVVSGTTEEKGNTILAAALNNNFEVNVLAFDKYNLPLVETGKVAENMIKKTKELERPHYDAARIPYYKEFFDQGTVFIEERHIEKRIPHKILNKMDFASVKDIKNITWTTNHKVEKYCQTVMHPGPNVYLGTMKQFFLDNQPFLFTREVLPRSVVKQTYGKWQRWKNVPMEGCIFEISDTNVPYNDHSKEVGGGSGKIPKCEVIRYQCKDMNEYMVIINGVMMLPIGFPLSALLGRVDYTIAKGDAFPISFNFAYSKSFPAKTKVEQSVYDEMLRLMVMKTQQSFKPPMANNTGKILSSDILLPGVTTADIDPNKYKPLIDPTGVTSAEMNSILFIKSIIDGKTVNPIFEGQSTPGEKTAREAMELKQQSMQRLGLPILGLVNLEKRLAELRFYNILQNDISVLKKDYKGVREKVLKTITVDGDLEDGSKGQNIINFVEGELPDSEQIYAEEELTSRAMKKNTRITYLNQEQMTSVSAYYYFRVVPTQRDASEIRVATFNETLERAKTMFPDRLNNAYWENRWAIINGEDPNKAFMQQGTMPPGQAPMVPPGAPQGNMSSQITGAKRPVPGAKSLNRMVNAR